MSNEIAQTSEEIKALVKTVYILCEHTGENGTTARTPRRAWTDADEELLNITAQRCVSFDNDMLVSINLWEKKAIEIPIWMTEKELIESFGGNLRYYIGFGGEIHWTESWFRKLIKLDNATRYAVIKLIKQKSFRAEKRKELYTRFVSWLNGSGELEKYDLCNVRNVYTDQEASRCETRLYWSR